MKHPPMLGIQDDWRNAGFGLYVHWPFCQSKCPYCDFNSHVSSKVDQSEWIDALQAEIDRQFELTGPRTLRSIFFGGGTPSLMEARTVQAVLDRAQQTWGFSNDIEITLEANPTSVEATRFHDYARAGVNRVSLGVQALNDTDLKRLGRLHSSMEALKALDIAQKHFGRVSFDLIYARQDQSLSDWEKELQRALDIGSDHLSLYQLTIEEGTAFGELYKRGKLKGLPDSDMGADFFDLTGQICADAGLPRYETSNHARPGEESRHNLIYWRYGDYAGVGPGAHGRLTISGTKYATEATKAPGAWLSAVRSAKKAASTMAPLTPSDAALEMLLMGIRLAEGVDLGRLDGLDPELLDRDAAKSLAEQGLLTLSDTRLAATPAGQPLLNALLRSLIR